MSGRCERAPGAPVRTLGRSTAADSAWPAQRMLDLAMPGTRLCSWRVFSTSSIIRGLAIAASHFCSAGRGRLPGMQQAAPLQAASAAPAAAAVQQQHSLTEGARPAYYSAWPLLFYAHLSR